MKVINTMEDKLGGLVEFLNYVVIYDEATKLYCVYSPSYPDVRKKASTGLEALNQLKVALSDFVLD